MSDSDQESPKPKANHLSLVPAPNTSADTSDGPPQDTMTTSETGNTGESGPSPSDALQSDAPQELQPTPDLSHITADHVRAYLSAHPEFFTDNQDILDLAPPLGRNLGEGVVDLQKSMNQRMREDLSHLKQWREQFVSHSEANLSLIERYHAAAFVIVDAGSLSEMTETVEHSLPEILEVDAASLLVEAADVPASWLDQGLRAIAPGRSAVWMGGDEILLRPSAQDRVAIHGPKASMVQSDALIRLPMPEGYPRIMLAMGIGRAEHFHPDQGTEYLAFLSAIIARCLMRWAPL